MQEWEREREREREKINRMANRNIENELDWDKGKTYLERNLKTFKVFVCLRERENLKLTLIN